VISISLSTGGAVLRGSEGGVDNIDNNILIILLIMIRKIISKMISKPCGIASTGLFSGVMIRKRLDPNHPDN
jgi:hypothetical protein